MTRNPLGPTMWRSSQIDPGDLKFTWLCRLRWGTMVGQVLFVAAIEVFMSVPVDLVAASSLVGAVGISNLALDYWYRRAEVTPDWMPFAVLVADVVLFTGLLAVSGGASNPFSFLYVLYIAVAALMLDGVSPWIVAGTAIAGYGSLYLGNIGLPVGAGGTDVHRHLYGMWFAMAVTGAMMAYFVNMIRHELERRGERLREVQEMRSRRKRLASLATMAAGAAHELSTPISTIAVVANELRRIGEQRDADDVAHEAAVIRDEVDRCEEILDKMAADSGRFPDAQFQTVSPIEVAEKAKCRVDEPSHVDISREHSRDISIAVPLDAFVENLSGVIDNGLRASPEEGSVEVTIVERGEEVEFQIEDFGEGMAPETRRHAVEPFFTTREPGEGMGLGLYLARELVEGLGGTLTIESERGSGTTVHLSVPSDAGPHSGRSHHD